VPFPFANVPEFNVLQVPLEELRIDQSTSSPARSLISACNTGLNPISSAALAGNSLEMAGAEFVISNV
jgi:hypothetical protein